MRYHSNSDLGKAYEAGYVDGRAAAQSGPPREPTRAMLDAGLAYYEGRTGARMVTIGGIWDAMYDAWAQEQTSGAASAVTDGPAADPLPVAWATPSLLVTMSAVEKRLLTSPEMRGRGAGWEADARDADRYSVPLYRAAALDRLRAERDALRECVRAADAMALECRRVGLISSTWLEDYDDARAKVKP